MKFSLKLPHWVKCDYDKWIIFREGEICRKNSDSVVGFIITQKRICRTCGKTQIETSSSYL